jgi:hypothetical protein
MALGCDSLVPSPVSPQLLAALVSGRPDSNMENLNKVSKVKVDLVVLERLGPRGRKK